MTLRETATIFTDGGGIPSEDMVAWGSCTAGGGAAGQLGSCAFGGGGGIP